MFTKLKNRKLNNKLSNIIRDTEDLFIDKTCKELKIKDINKMSKAKKKKFLDLLLSYSKKEIIKSIDKNNIDWFKAYKINLNKIDKIELKSKILNFNYNN